MSKAQIKKSLKTLSREDLIDLIIELYDNIKPAKEYIEFWNNPDINSAIEKYQEKLSKIYFSKTGRVRKKPKFSEVKRIFKEFTVMISEPDIVSELHLYNIEQFIRWTEKRFPKKSDIKTLINFIETAEKHLFESGMSEIYLSRIISKKETAENLYKVLEYTPT